jgi:hypothetical protein
MSPLTSIHPKADDRRYDEKSKRQKKHISKRQRPSLAKSAPVLLMNIGEMETKRVATEVITESIEEYMSHSDNVKD